MTCCRRQGEQQSHIQPTCPDFFDALHEVPDLLAKVSPSDWAVLLGCSKQLRHVVHSSVQAIKVTHDEDVTLVLKGSWPQLMLIKLRQTVLDSMRVFPYSESFEPASCNFHVIAKLHARLEDKQLPSAFIVRPLAKQLQLDQHIAAALLNLHSAGWQQPKELWILLSKEVIAQMTCSDWSATAQPSLNSIAGCAAVEQLLKRSWPQCSFVDLTEALMDEDQMTVLINGFKHS